VPDGSVMLAGAAGMHTRSADKENNKYAQLLGWSKMTPKWDIIYALSLIKRKYFGLEKHEF
jgi:hypothetical protein